MPSSQNAATERRNSDRTITHEPPKLKTTLKTPPKQATNPLQFVKVGPCSLYRTAQEQLQKVQEVKKIKQEIRDDPEDWQSNLDNWKSSRRKRQEHIIERVVEVKKLELEEHDRQRRRSKTFSEMMEERGSRGRKLSISLAMYNEEDTNDLSDLGIGTSSGKSSISGDTHDDAQSVLELLTRALQKQHERLVTVTAGRSIPNGFESTCPSGLIPLICMLQSDRDSEIDKSHSDVDNAGHSNGNELPAPVTFSAVHPSLKKDSLDNGFHKLSTTKRGFLQEYELPAPETASSPEPEEYTYEGAIRGYVSRVAQNMPRRSLARLDAKLERSGSNGHLAPLKVDVLKRCEIFERAARDPGDVKNNNGSVSSSNSSIGSLSGGGGNNNRERSEPLCGKSIKERLSSLERQKSDLEEKGRAARISFEATNALKERLYSKSKPEKELKMGDLLAEEIEVVKPLQERLSSLEKLVDPCEQSFGTVQLNGEIKTKNVKERLVALDVNRCSDDEKRGPNCFREEVNNRAKNSTPSERSSSPDSEYRSPRGAIFHHSLDSLDADASSGPDTFERVQSLEELDYRQAHRYPASSSSTEVLNDTDREDSGIHTADASCSVSQADEPIEEDAGPVAGEQLELLRQQQQPLLILEEKTEFRGSIEAALSEANKSLERIEEKIIGLALDSEACDAVLTEMGTADTSSSSSASGPALGLSANWGNTEPWSTNANKPRTLTSSSRPVVYQSPRIPPRRTAPETPSRPFQLAGLRAATPPRLASPAETSADVGSPPSPLARSPLVSPRSPSKIPTPLPRRSVEQQAPALLPSKHRVAPSSIPQSAMPSEIPLPVKPTNGCHDPNIPSSPEARQRDVVNLCQKVVVPRAQAQVTPFVIVERYADEANANTESEPEPLEPSTREEEQPVDELAEEEPEPVDASEEDGEEAESPEVKMEGGPPVRPTSLALERTSLCSDFLSPISPVSKQILPLSFSSDEEIITGLSFPLGPPTSVEPPKEKPPPPPVDLSDEENMPIEPLKRLNSTRRIKKELRTRRSDFLGIEGFNDEELERELTLTKPPDMAAILAEERRIEQLHRRSYDTDSNYEQDSSHERDSGVELGQAEDWAKQPVSPDMSQHSRQSSEPFGASVTSSEEDEITKKEREIIEVLEREEQWRYENKRETNSDIGEKLAHKLRELEEEKMLLERERASKDVSDLQQQEQQRRRHQEPSAETLRMNVENLRVQEELQRKEDEEAARQLELEKQLVEEQADEDEEEESKLQRQIRMQDHERRSLEVRRQDDVQIRTQATNTQENKPVSPSLSANEDEYASREVLRVERELLQLEQEELKRQRSNLAYREQKQQQLAEKLHEQWKSLQDVAQSPPAAVVRQTKYGSKPLPASLNYRSSMPNLLQETGLGQRRRPPPPPIPPAKPLRLVEQRQRDVTIRSSRVPSADSIPQQVEAPSKPSAHHGQQMSRQTLQALSAVPRPRIVQADQWVQRRKSDVPRAAQDYNYQHWLIQEAEQRRINEKNQRSPGRKPHVTGTSVPYTASPPRSDSKPLPDSIIQTITQRIQNRVQEKPLPPRRRLEHSTSQEHLHSSQQYQMQQHKIHQSPNNSETQEKMLSVSGKKKCSHCGDELGRGAAMIIESLRLFYHMECFKCCVCHVRLGDGLMGTDVRVRNHKLHCHNCYSSDDGVKFSCV